MSNIINNIFRRSSLSKKDGEHHKKDNGSTHSDEPYRFTVTFTEQSNLGFRIGRDVNNKGVVISDVLVGSVAAEKGLAKGDYVTSIQDKNVTELSDDDCLAKMRQRPLKLALERPLVEVAVAHASSRSVISPQQTGQNQPASKSRTPVKGQKYDVLHRIAIDNNIRNEPVIPPADYPPEPKTGWRWRPCVLEDFGSDSKENRAHVQFLDVLPNYPSNDIVELGEKLQYLQPFGSKSPPHIMHHNYRSDDVLDVLDIYPGKHTQKLQRKWRKCQIVAVAPYYIRVTFVGWDRGYDLWVHVIEEHWRLAEFGTHTEKEEIEETDREKEFRKQMLAKGLRIVDVEPDGNCLFRAVSLLLYGDESRHAEIRTACCDYMSEQPKRFEFLVEEGSTFDDYVAHMRQDKVWGDEPELRVIEELYDRPISMFSCDIVGIGANADITEPLAHYRVGEEVAGLEKTEPLRLSFHGNNHYNAVVKEGATPKYDPNPRKNDQRIRNHRLKQNDGSMVNVGTLRHHTSSFSLKRSASAVSNSGK